MPPELRRAHRQNDRAVFAAYDMKAAAAEPEIVVKLMGRYREMTEKR